MIAITLVGVSPEMVEDSSSGKVALHPGLTSK